MTNLPQLKEAVSFLEKKLKTLKIKKPELSIILGSGLGDFGSNLQTKLIVEYKDIPNFPVSTVFGHSGKLILAHDEKTGKHFWVMQGRVHFYEGYSMAQVIFPTRLFALLGVKRLIVTNAAGGVNRMFDAGDLMIIRDHINLMEQTRSLVRTMKHLGQDSRI